MSMNKYPPEVTLDIVSTYQANPNIETVRAIATKYNRSENSIRSKLAREGVYVPMVRNTGKRDITKSELVFKIAEVLNTNPDQLESLEKANAPVLKIVLEALATKI